MAPQDADSGIAKVMDRLRYLENLVKELGGQLEQARAAASSGDGGSSGLASRGGSTHDPDAEHQMGSSPATSTSSVQKQFGRLVLQDASRSRYVSSGFWSRINDELDGLKIDTCGLVGDEFDSSEDEASPTKSPSTHEPERTPSERNAFLFRHNLSPSAHDLREFHPLPSQIPFLLDVFSENVNCMIQIVHIPTVTKMVRELRGSDMTRLTPVNEALLFSIYYAAITSMEEDDVMTSFGSTQADLHLKYRLGLEHALAKADFLNVPDITLVQALALFLCVVRRHDSPRFVWMMTGLLIRMALYLGLQRDGTHFEKLNPLEIEMRRRVWWVVCMLDLRASEDQGTDLAITTGSFDTRIPLSINVADISPESKQMPTERHGVTDMSFAIINARICVIMRQMMASAARDGAAGLEDQSGMLNEIYQTYERGYFQYTTESGNIAYWVGVNIARLAMAKMTLIMSLPVLFSSPSEHFSDEIRTRLLVAAIEVAEYNHALNAEQACRQWRWIFQTYTHWYAIVYLMIEISRRPWSPIVERAWVALHSEWLIPVQKHKDKNLRMWFPLRKLMAKDRKHRDAELNRLRADPQAVARLDMEDQKITLPSSCVLLPTASNVRLFRERWRKLMGIPERAGDDILTVSDSGGGLADPAVRTTYTSQPPVWSIPTYRPGDLSFDMTFEPKYPGTSAEQASQSTERTSTRVPEPAITINASSELPLGQPVGLSYDPSPVRRAHWSDDGSMEPGFVPWLWADADPSVDVFSDLDVDPRDADMDLDGEVNWYGWIQSAKGMEWETRPSGNGRT